MIAGIILAAGASSRMGSPKALLDYRGETFIQRLVRVLSAVCDPVIVVLGYHADALRPAVPDATIVVNPAPERGQLSSLQTGLAALPAAAEGFLFTPVDSPAVDGATVERLAAEFLRRTPTTLLVIPRYQGKRGHPVFATRAIANELSALPLTAQAREVIHGHIPDTLYIDVDDPGILTDIDDREAYRRLSEAAPVTSTMKRGIRIGIILVVAIAVLGVALPYAPVDFLKAPLERALERSLGRKVEVDAVSLTLFSGPGASLDGVTIHDDPRAGIEPFAYANTLDARISLLGLLRGRLEFSSLHLNDATFNLVKPDNAPWNFQMLLHRTAPAAASLPTIKVRGGRVNFKFAQTKSVLYFDDTDLDVSPGYDGEVDLRFSGVPARTDQSAQNFGHFYVRGTAAPSLNLRVELEPSALDAVARLFDSSGAGLKGVVALDAQLSGSPSALDVKGILQLEGAGEWRVGYKGKLDLVGQTLELDSTSPPGLNTRLHVLTRDLLTTPQWEVSADFLDASLGSAVDMARKLGAPLPEKMTAEGVVSGTARYRNTEGLGGNLEVRDASLTIPDATPLKIATATVFLKDKTIVAGPNTVQIGDQGTADVEATYQAGNGGGTELKITTRRMNIADLRALGGAVPLLDRVTDGTWRGTLTYQKPVAAAGNWSGDFEVQNTSLAVDGIADPVQVQSASVTVNPEQVSVTRLRAKAGDIAFTGEYRWTSDAAQPQRFRLQIPDAASLEIERLFQPTTSREGGLLARTLRLGAAGATPEWLTQRNAEGTVSIQSLTVADTRFSVNTSRVSWNGDTVKVSAIQGKVADAALTGELSVDLSGRAPAYRFDGKLEDVAYKGGKLDFNGRVTATGTGLALIASVKAEGTLRGRAVAFSPDAEFRRVSGRFALSMTPAGPKWKLSALELTQGTDSYSGDGATQADGKLVLDLLSGGRQFHYP